MKSVIPEETLLEAYRIMSRERHRPFPCSVDGLETATLINELIQIIKRLESAE